MAYLDTSRLTEAELWELRLLSNKVMEALLLQWTDPEMFEAICALYNDFRAGLVLKYHGEENE